MTLPLGCPHAAHGIAAVSAPFNQSSSKTPMAIETPNVPLAGRKPGAMVFAVLYMLESTTRALVLTVMPLQAKEIFGSDARVTAIYLCVTIFGLVAGFAVPLLIHRYRRRWVYSMGLIVGGLAVVALALPVASMERRTSTRPSSGGSSCRVMSRFAAPPAV